MAWDQLTINKPHLVYIILGGFTSLFMLCSSVIKERLYIGEATVATICGIIFGPHAANLINPGTWGNTDQITEEFSRIVLVVQCFAVGVELPKAYMERHWRSVTFLLVPVMTFGWLVTSLFIWAVFSAHLSWLDSLTIAACVTATDPVLASSVVGKGKFAKRVPKHLRDLLSAESGCNDGMAFPFIYLALYIIRYQPNANQVAFHWFCYTILYECVFGAFYGVCVGYLARRLIRLAHERDLIDRESFLVFYFVLALFCAGSGSILGIDDLLVGFSCGVGFSNDGWFTEKTEESAVSNVIDLLINLTFFVYFGTIIPWQEYNSGYMGLNVWRLVVIGILVLFFRRIPVMLAFKPLIPDIKTWREALFAGHFGPIGVGAIFVAILARAELENEETTPSPTLPDSAQNPRANVIYLVWPIVTFLVICSIVVHGSSIAVFTLGKHINTLTLTMSYTQANEQGPSWMERLPRIQSRSKTSMSLARSESSFDEKPGLPPGMLPIGAPGTFLRRQREEDNPSRAQSRASSRHRSRKSRNWDSGRGPGGPISQSAISPAPRAYHPDQPLSRSDSETLAIQSEPPSNEKSPTSETEEEKKQDKDDDAGEIFEEGHHTVYEDEEGNVLAVENADEDGGQLHREESERTEGRRLMHKEHADENEGVAPSKDDPNTDPGHEALKHVESAEEEATEAVHHPGRSWRRGLARMETLTGRHQDKDGERPKKKQEKPKETRGPARAYQYGNTIIVEDEDGEVIKKYDIPAPDRKHHAAADPDKSKHRIGQMGKLLGMGGGHGGGSRDGAKGGPSAADASGSPSKKGQNSSGAVDGTSNDDDRIRFTITQGGRRMSKAEFIDKIRAMDPKSRVEAVENSDAPEPVKVEARKDVREQAQARTRFHRGQSMSQVPIVPENASVDNDDVDSAGTAAAVEPVTSESSDLQLVDSNRHEIPFHDVSSQLRRFRMGGDTDGETAAERRRRQALQQPVQDEDSEDDGTDRIPPRRRESSPSPDARAYNETADTGETAAERRRREGALGLRREDDSDSEEDDQPREVPQRQNIRFVDEPTQRERGRTTALKWGKNVRR